MLTTLGAGLLVAAGVCYLVAFFGVVYSILTARNRDGTLLLVTAGFCFLLASCIVGYGVFIAYNPNLQEIFFASSVAALLGIFSLAAQQLFS